MFYLILALRAVGPFIYCLLVGCSFAIILKKSFTVSLPVAFCTQIVIMMLTGMLFNSVNLGIWVFVAFCTIAGIIRLFNCGFKASFNSFTPNQVALFTATYFAVYVLNYAKCFDSWDEFSHWGHFVKETLRLDALFCTSPLKFAHKDYVPAISLFEALWCRLSLGYNEANVFRATQMLQITMILSAVHGRKVNDDNKTKTNRLATIAVTLALLSIPLLFSSLRFYHTICVDLAFGVMIFYSMWIVLSNEEWSRADIYSLVTALSVLILSKMTALVFLPMVVCFYAALHSKKAKMPGKCLYFGSIATSLFIPLILWFGFNRFMSEYKAFDGGYQGYGHFTIDLVKDVLLHNGAITYQEDVERAYFAALVKEPVAGCIPYVWTIIVCVAMLFIWAKLSGQSGVRMRTIKLLAMWNVLAGIAYAIEMWFLYLTAFSEGEARELASFDRYMSSYLIAIVLLDISFMFYYSKQSVTYVIATAGIAACCVTVSIVMGTIDQIFPGNIGGWWQIECDEPAYEWEVFNLKNKLPEEANVYVISVGKTESAIVLMGYYLSPMRIYGSGLDFVNYKTLTSEGLIKRMSDKDYIYVRCIEDDGEDFVAKYSECFDDPLILYPGAIIRIDDIRNDVIECTLIDEISLGDG